MASSTILSRKIITPSPPTPSSHRHCNLSFRDQTANTLYLPIAALYSKPENHTITQISNILENSLSKILYFYYPFGGRIKDNKYVDCNDIGAEYFNVHINCQMSEILSNPYNDAIEIVFPQNMAWGNSLSEERSSLLVVQLSHFDCGGVGISICLSHKVADGYSAFKFLGDWISMARDDHKLNFQPSPQFDGALFLPPIDNPPPMPNVVPDPQQCVSRMYNLSSSTLSKLKDSIVSTNPQIQNPSRIEVAMALIHKCGVDVSMSKSGVFRPTMLYQVMNLRPPIPLNTMGNATCLFSTIAMSIDKTTLPSYVGELQKAKQQLRHKLKQMDTNQLASHAIEKLKEIVNIANEDVFDIYFCTSLCTFGSHKIDFGWGSPLRVTQVKHPTKNKFMFLDDPSGEGINVLITLTEADMLLFQNNKELLEFASPVVQSLE
ncbi:acylsugar acyltransferase 3-like [Solanum lycopersicum]|uniref:Acylsugar acyltransferase 3 n=1 Tax=Solanum lycopersicum TaxID=4081 RepID=A0A3Q7IZM3_SOLLC